MKANKAVWLLTLAAAIHVAQASEYLILYKDPSTVPAIAPPDGDYIAIDYSVWRDIPHEYRAKYNPARYPAVVHDATGAVAENPGTWTNALARLTAAKPDALKTAENALIGLLRRTGYIPTNAVAIPPGTRAAVETNLIAIAIDDPTGEAANLITRYAGLITIIQSYGADPENAVWHDE